MLSFGKVFAKKHIHMSFQGHAVFSWYFFELHLTETKFIVSCYTSNELILFAILLRLTMALICMFFSDVTTCCDFTLFTVIFHYLQTLYLKTLNIPECLVRSYKTIHQIIQLDQFDNKGKNDTLIYKRFLSVWQSFI